MLRTYITRGLAAVLAGAAVFVLTACSAEQKDESPDTEGSAVIIDPAPEPQIEEPLNGEENEEKTPLFPEADRALSLDEGGNFVKMGKMGAFISPEGGIALADLESMEYSFISESSASRLYFDGVNIYYRGDGGIYRVSGEGESLRLTEDMTYCMTVDDSRIYYIKQTDFGTDEPRGELWSMDKSGQNAVIILPFEIEGRFAVRDGWVYYISASDGMLYRSMLFGSEQEKIAADPKGICTVTDHNLYYRDNSDRERIHRVDLKTKSSASVGAYASIVQVGGSVYVMARQERGRGLEPLFSLTEFDDASGEGRRILDFKNIGDDTLVYYWDDHAYIRRPGGDIYRININDPEQEKTEALPSETVFSEGKAYFLSGRGFKVFDCTTSETFDSKQK